MSEKQSEGQDPSIQNPDALKAIQESLKKMAVTQPSSNAAHSVEEAIKREYKFWKTQPVVQLDEREKRKDYVGPLEPPKADIRQEPYTLPEGFYWDTVDVLDDVQLEHLYQLLNENYVEDGDAMFRFDYSKEFLRWALLPPGWKRNWHTAVRAAKSGKLLAFISAIPADLRISDREQRLVEINFLCVHKKLRAKRLAPVLIMEITRRVHQEGIFQACFTAGVFLPTPVARCRYWHRSLNPKKLIDVRFSQLHPKMTMAMTVKMYKVPEAPVTPGFRAMEPKDVAAVAQLHKEYQAQFKMTPVFTEDECAHWLLPRDKVVSSYVVEDPKTNQVVDFTSFYALNSTVIGHPRHKTLNAAYAFYTTSFTVPLKQMLQDALIMANKLGFDVFNALDLMHNGEVLKDLKFGIGDGNLQYYLYNYAHPEIEPKDVGLVLL